MDTLSKLNLFSDHKVVNGVYVRFFGVYILVLSGTSPDDSELMWWASIPKGTFFSDVRKTKLTRIDRSQLISLFRFELHPDSLSPMPFRRHHKTSEIVVLETTPLGFECERTIVKRS